ncbi:MAG: Hpt domain-containing protein [Geothrix sp.]|nr:Hpt domain-containing protein [Geothrix sp.]
MNDLPILDPRPLRDLLDIGAGMELVQELVGLLKEDAPPRLLTLRAAVEAADDETAVHEAHQLKGALGNLGLQRFAELAAQVEAHVHAGRRDSARALAESLPAAYEEALAALQEAFPKA